MATASPNVRVLSPGEISPVRVRGTTGARGPLVQALRRTVTNPMGVFGITVVSLLLIGAIAAPLISPFDPIEQHPGSELLPPGGQFPLGTDNLGRDLLSGILFGSRSSLLVGMVAVGLGARLGIASGVG